MIEVSGRVSRTTGNGWLVLRGPCATAQPVICARQVGDGVEVRATNALWPNGYCEFFIRWARLEDVEAALVRLVDVDRRDGQCLVDRVVRTETAPNGTTPADDAGTTSQDSPESASISAMSRS